MGKFWPFWLRLSGREPHLQEGSISLKFLLETRLKSESFDLLIIGTKHEWVTHTSKFGWMYGTAFSHT